MAIGKTAGCLILAGAAWAWAAQFPVRYEHLGKPCDGLLTVDEGGVRFEGSNRHAWRWKFTEIQELQLSPASIHILTYKDSRLRLGADREYRFAGKIPATDLYAFLRGHMDQRLVAQMGEVPAGPGLSLPVKHAGRMMGSEGELVFGGDSVVYATASRGQSRTWRYADIDSISSADRFELTITTLEKSFHFQLKQPITEARYNELWLQIEKKNGRIQ